MIVIKFLFLLGFYFINTSLFALDRLQLDKPIEELKLGSYLYILEDESKTLKILDILNSDKRLLWTKSNMDSPNFGFIDKTIWTKISILNNIGTNSNYLLEIDFPRLDYIDLYIERKENIEKFSSGSLVPFDLRQFKYRNPLYELKFQPGEEITLYFKIESKTSMQFPLILYSKEKFQEKNNSEQLLHGLHFGILILSTLYGILLFRLMKDWSNLLFSLYSLGILFVFLIITGIGFQYFWRNNPEINHYNSFSILLSISLGLQFSRSVLNDKKSNRFMSLVFNWITGFTLILVILSFFIPYSISIKMGMAMAVLSAFLIVGSGFTAILNNYKPGIYIFIAALCGLTEWSIRILHNFGFVNFYFSFSDTMILRCSERVILCLALIAKVQVIKDENDKAQIQRLEDEIKIQEKLSLINASMELQVIQRTKELEKEKEIAIRANRLKDNFITTVSHDLKSPILNTKNLLDVLIKKEAMDWEERLYYLQSCHNSLTSTYQMIYNILNLDRFESGFIEINHQYVDIYLILQKVISELEYSSRFKNISIYLAAKEDLIVIGDSQLLFQLFSNLVSNAIKFSFENSTVKIAVSEVKGYFQIEIEDNGTGINESEKQKILLHSSFSKPGTKGEVGTGFGLGIVNQILSLHDGLLEIRSDPGKGSIFKINLPCQDRLAICFSEEKSFYEEVKAEISKFQIRIIRIYEAQNLLIAIQNLNPDYLLIGIDSLKSSSYKELITISRLEAINSIPVYIKVYSELEIGITELNFSRITLDDKTGNRVSKIEEFIINHPSSQ